MSAIKLNQKNNQSLLSRGYTDMVRAYLHDIGQVPLLSHYEEIIYGKKVQHMMSLLTEKEKLEQQRGHCVNQLEWADALSLSEDQLNQILEQGQQANVLLLILHFI